VNSDFVKPIAQLLDLALQIPTLEFAAVEYFHWDPSYYMKELQALILFRCCGLI
jgi:hypothetical protein